MDYSYLSKRQKGVLYDLFSGKFTLEDVLKKRKVSRRTYQRWHDEHNFSEEFHRLMDLAAIEQQLVFVRYGHDIAMKLVNLSAAEKDETARKACMGIITNPIV